MRCLLVLALGTVALLTAGCGGEPRQLAGPPEEALALAASASDVKGIPLLGWYRWGEDGYVTIPVLGIYHRKDLSLGFFGLIHLGTTHVDRDAAGRAVGVGMRDFNVLGFYNASERQFLEGDKLVRERSRRLFWFLPLGKTREEIPALAAGGIRGLPPLWFYQNNFLWHVTAPVLLSHHSDDLNLGLMGAINLGTRRVARDEAGAIREVTLQDFNLLGLWGSTERVYREGDHAFRKMTRHLLWIFAF